MLFLSNGYLASAWCRQELETFVANAGTESGRIFVVQMAPVEQEHEALRDLVKYSFWYMDERNEPRTRWFPLIDPTDREYAAAQQSLARDLAAKLGERLRPEPPPLPVGPELHSAAKLVVAEAVKQQEAQRLPGNEDVDDDRLVLVSGGEEDRELVHAIAKQLERHNLGVAMPLCVLADQSDIKSSTLTRDLRTKLGLCDSVLMVFNEGPLDQVSQYLVECLKASARAAKSGQAPSIDLCQTRSDSLALGLHPRGMRIHVVGTACADECVDWFLDEAPP